MNNKPILSSRSAQTEIGVFLPKKPKYYSSLYIEGLIQKQMLLHWIRQGNYEKVRLEIENGAMINQPEPKSHKTPLIVACQKMDERMISVLLQSGADPNLVDAKGNSPLMVAVGNPTLSDTALRICNSLLNANADIQHTNHEGESALDIAFYFPKPSAVSSILSLLLDRLIVLGGQENWISWGFKAIQFDQPAALSFLLGKGLSPNAKNQFGNSLLTEACRMHKAQSILILLRAGADFQEIPAYGWDNHVLSTACNFGLDEALEFLSEKGFLQQASPDLVQTAINHAISNEQWAVLTFLEENGIDIVEYRPGTKPSLHTAIQYGTYKAFKPWQNRNSDWDIRDEAGNPPLHYAAFYNRMAYAKDALKNGASVDAVNKKGWSALMQCAASGSEEIAELLLQLNPQIDQQCTESGVTALFIAASEGRANLVNALLKAGANPQIHALNGKIARTEAIANGHSGIGSVLGPDIPHFNPHFSESSAKICAYCAEELQQEQIQHNYCTVCKAYYCDQHYEWGRWHRTDPTEIYPSRKGSCPNGHVKWEHE